jgi:hypothetical protein
MGHCKQRNTRQNSPSPEGCSEKKCSENLSRNGWFLLHDNALAQRSLVVAMYAKHNVKTLVHPPYSPDCHRPTFPVSETAMCSERITIRERQGSQCKSDEITDNSNEK